MWSRRKCLTQKTRSALGVMLRVAAPKIGLQEEARRDEAMGLRSCGHSVGDRRHPQS